MKGTYGFRATIFATEQAKAFVARIVPLLADEPRFQDEVPVGGKFRD
jgi:hypothetical protein